MELNQNTVDLGVKGTVCQKNGQVLVVQSKMKFEQDWDRLTENWLILIDCIE